jgi:hypothetical protein
MNNLLALWLILHGVLVLVSTKVPEWVDPLLAIVVGVILLGGGLWKQRTP